MAAATPSRNPWSITTDPSSEVEIRKDIQTYGSGKAVSTDGFSPALMKLMTELEVLFTKFWYSEKASSLWGV